MPRRSQKLDLRLTPEAKQMLYLAALAAHCSMSEFVLEGALAHAAEVLTERRRFTLNEAQWAEFMATLDAPAETYPRMERLLQEPSVFELGELHDDATH